MEATMLTPTSAVRLYRNVADWFADPDIAAEFEAWKAARQQEEDDNG